MIESHEFDLRLLTFKLTLMFVLIILNLDKFLNINISINNIYTQDLRRIFLIKI